MLTERTKTTQGNSYKVKSFPASDDFCRLLITFANNLDSDQARQNVGPDLDPNCLALRWYSCFFFVFFLLLFFWKKIIIIIIIIIKKKIYRRQKKKKKKNMQNYPACKGLITEPQHEKNVPSVIFAQRRLRAASVQSDQSLRCPHEETVHPWLSTICAQCKFGSKCANAQADLNLSWAHMSKGLTSYMFLCCCFHYLIRF